MANHPLAADAEPLTGHSEDLTPDDWRWVAASRDPEQVAHEVRYVRQALAGMTCARHLLVIGAGHGGLAISLAQAGYRVTGLAPSGSSVEEARRLSDQASVEAHWQALDPVSGAGWPSGQFDAVVWVDLFGWGSDADRRRLLRCARRSLTPDGMLVLSTPNALSAHNRSGDRTTWESDRAEYARTQRYETRTGRTWITLSVDRPGQRRRRIQYDLRLYTPSELTALLRECGFDVCQVDGDFKADSPPHPEAQTVQIVARALPTPATTLAVASWGTPPDARLDLRYAPDEALWLDPAPERIWRDVIDALADGGAGAIGSYPVDDPYGGERSATILSAQHGCPIAPDQITFGAGVTPLLRQLSDLADGGTVLSGRLCHPDVPVWAMQRGSVIQTAHRDVGSDEIVRAIARTRPALVHLDRPTFTGNLDSYEALLTIGRAAAGVGAVVLIDEAPSTYLGPAASAIQLTQQLDNLVVVRGFTKAYSWGGARIGYAVASREQSGRVRELVPPLQVSELSFLAAVRLLALGDIFGQLRNRIGIMKPRAAAALRDWGLQVQPGHRALPWLVVTDPAGASARRLAERGIHGLPLAVCPSLRGTSSDLLQLFVPLAEERMRTFEALLAGQDPPMTAGRHLGALT